MYQVPTLLCIVYYIYYLYYVCFTISVMVKIETRQNTNFCVHYSSVLLSKFDLFVFWQFCQRLGYFAGCKVGLIFVDISLRKRKQTHLTLVYDGQGSTKYDNFPSLLQPKLLSLIDQYNFLYFIFVVVVSS